MCVRAEAKATASVTSTSTDAYFIPLTDWVSSVGLDGLRLTQTLRNLVNDPAVKPGYQASPVRTNNPSTPVVITDGTYQTTAGTETYDESPPAALQSTMFIRFGVWVKQNQSSSNVARCDVELQVSILFSGEILGANTVDVVPGIPNDQVMYFPLTDWYPAVGADKAIGAFVVMDNESTSLDYRLAARTASDPSDPDSWQDLETGWTTPSTGNSERNTGEVALSALSPSIDAVQSIQLGVAVKATSSTATIRAFIHGACAIVQTH